MVLPCLDVVLGLTARAVEPLVKVLGAAAFETGDDEPGIGSLNPDLDAGDDALHSAPALGGIVELREAPHLAAPGRRLEARGGALLQRCDMAAQCCIGGFFFQAEDGIRDRNVTGVQTCALPICHERALAGRPERGPEAEGGEAAAAQGQRERDDLDGQAAPAAEPRNELVALDEDDLADRKSVV